MLVIRKNFIEKYYVEQNLLEWSRLLGLALLGFTLSLAIQLGVVVRSLWWLFIGQVGEIEHPHHRINKTFEHLGWSSWI